MLEFADSSAITVTTIRHTAKREMVLIDPPGGWLTQGERRVASLSIPPAATAPRGITRRGFLRTTVLDWDKLNRNARRPERREHGR